MDKHYSIEYEYNDRPGGIKKNNLALDEVQNAFFDIVVELVGNPQGEVNVVIKNTTPKRG